MKTKDGKEANVGSYYYLENGTQVLLESCATTPEGNEAFLVAPFYEGETMSANGDGGFHNEITAEYEHEGEPTLVKAIFSVAPTEKLCVRYKNKLNEIEALSLALGSLKKDTNKILEMKNKLIRETTEAERLHVIATGKLKSTKGDIETLNEQISEKRQRLSELEDSIGDMKSEDVSSLVSKVELMRLNKRDFELDCLEAGGVDNWDWYGESLKPYCERYPE